MTQRNVRNDCVSLYSLNLLIFFELPIVGICLLGSLAFAMNTTIGLAMTCDVYQKNLHHESGRYPYGTSIHQLIFNSVSLVQRLRVGPSQYESMTHAFTPGSHSIIL